LPPEVCLGLQIRQLDAGYKRIAACAWTPRLRENCGGVTPKVDVSYVRHAVSFACFERSVEILSSRCEIRRNGRGWRPVSAHPRHRSRCRKPNRIGEPYLALGPGENAVQDRRLRIVNFNVRTATGLANAGFCFGQLVFQTLRHPPDDKKRSRLVIAQ
jgi:hypothetical protein